MKKLINPATFRIIAIASIVIGIIADTFAFAAFGICVFALLFALKRKILLYIVEIIGAMTLVMAVMNGKDSYFFYGFLLTALSYGCIRLSNIIAANPQKCNESDVDDQNAEIK